jgi:hypothetical protein
MAITITGDAEADALLDQSPFALLVGMMLDQQIAMETAFTGPAKLRDRLGSLDPAGDRRARPGRAGRGDEADAVGAPLPLARWPAGCSRCPRRSWTTGVVTPPRSGRRATPSGAEVLRRLKALPGFGDQKARIFLALLGKQKGLQAPGWREAAGDYGTDGYRSVADIVSPESLTKVREHKRAMKAAAKG